MIVARCPLRISLCGGGSDLDSYLQKHHYGSVISFPSNLYSYITLFQDKYGYNKQKKFIINYTKREEVNEIYEIKNDIAREALVHFNACHVTLDFHSDVFSAGSGLASSSAYLIACLKAIATHKNIEIPESTLCQTALEIERKFNPLTGMQDIYGCAMGGFKRLNFYHDLSVTQQPLDVDGNFLKKFNIYLRPTGIRRKSTNILCTLDTNKAHSFLPLVESMHQAINNESKKDFLNIINEAWKIKKTLSPLILKDKTLCDMDNELTEDESVLAHKLCGAGNGGFFLLFKDSSNGSQHKEDIKIAASETGVEIINI